VCQITFTLQKYKKISNHESFLGKSFGNSKDILTFAGDFERMTSEMAG